MVISPHLHCTWVVHYSKGLDLISATKSTDIWNKSLNLVVSLFAYERK